MSYYLTVAHAGYYLLKKDASTIYQTISNMIGFLTIESATIIYQQIDDMSNYATHTKVDTVYYNLLSLFGLLSTVNNNSLLNFQTISSYYSLKSGASTIYMVNYDHCFNCRKC